MPTQTAKKKSTKARKPAAKKASVTTMAAKKTVKKTVRKASVVPRATASKVTAPKKKATPDSKRGFMWKLLEQKREAQKRAAAAKTENSVNPFERVQNSHASKGFGRFNGPRRRAA